MGLFLCKPYILSWTIYCWRTE